MLFSTIFITHKTLKQTSCCLFCELLINKNSAKKYFLVKNEGVLKKKKFEKFFFEKKKIWICFFVESKTTVNPLRKKNPIQANRPYVIDLCSVRHIVIYFLFFVKNNYFLLPRKKKHLTF